MIARNILQAWRLTLRQPSLSLLKVVGLGMGIAASILLIKYINWQWNFDRFHDHLNNIARIETHHHDPNSADTRTHAITYSGLPVLVKEKFPEVQSFVRFGRWIANDVVIRHEDELYRDDGLFFCDASFFEIFSFPLLAGDAKTALSDPNSVVLTKSLAHRFFGDTPALGKEILFENMKPLLVTGVVEDPPAQSHIQFDLLASLSTMTNWGLQVYGDQQLESAYVYSYLLLRNGTDLNELATAISREFKTRETTKAAYDSFSLRKMADIHLYASIEGDLTGNGDGNNIWILGGIALLILILGWINYFNIFFAYALERTTSLSIQRIVGADRSDLFAHLLTNAGLGIAISTILGVSMAIMAEPWISAQFGIPLFEVGLLDFSWRDPSFYLLLFLALGGVISMVLPAALLSSMTPINLLRGSALSSTVSKPGKQPILLALQFAIIMALLSGTMLIRHQMKFMHSQNLGVETSNVVAIRGPLGVDYQLLKANLTPFLNSVRALRGVEGVSISHHIPGDQMELVIADSQNPKGIPFNYYRNYGDPYYFDLFKIPFLALDSAKLANHSDRRFCIINKMTADLLGYFDPQEAVGHQFTRWRNELEIVGVVDNFHQRSLHHTIAPIIHDYSKDNFITDGFYSIRHSRKNIVELQEEIKELFNAYFPYTVYDPIIVDNHFRHQYQAESRFYLLNLAFSALGLVIGGIGLLALVMLTIGRRLKEISIRRILGANLENIVVLLAQDYIRILLISFVVATPITYYLMKQWLNNFAYQVEIGFWIFVMAGFLSIAMGVTIILYQGWRTTATNPVETLRTE